MIGLPLREVVLPRNASMLKATRVWRGSAVLRLGSIGDRWRARACWCVGAGV